MSRVVWKFPIYPKTELELPMDWEVVEVALQGEHPCVWVLLDPKLPKHRETFVAVGTGHDVPDNADHIGSWQMEGGALVFHLFVLGSPSQHLHDQREKEEA